MKKNWKKLSKKEIGQKHKLDNYKIKSNWALERKLNLSNLLRRNKKIHKNPNLK